MRKRKPHAATSTASTDKTGRGVRIPGDAPRPLRKEVLRAVGRKLAEAGGGASLRLVGGALISIDSGGGRERNGGGVFFFLYLLFFFCLVFRFALSPTLSSCGEERSAGIVGRERAISVGSGRMDGPWRLITSPIGPLSIYGQAQ